MANPKNKPSFWQRQYYVHEIQKTYAIWFGLFMFFSSLLVFTLAYMVSFIPPAFRLLSGGPLEERALAAKQFLFLAQAVLPGLLVLIPASAAFSIFLTHRMAGPLFRIEQSVLEISRGNLGLRIRLRLKDELQELAKLINEAVANFEDAVREIQQSGSRERGALTSLREEIRKHPSMSKQVLDRLDDAWQSGDQIESVLKRFQLSKPSA